MCDVLYFLFAVLVLHTVFFGGPFKRRWNGHEPPAHLAPPVQPPVPPSRRQHGR